MTDNTEQNVIIISSRVAIPLTEIELNPIRSQGAGGQNVNKVSSAIHLRFDINASSLPEMYKQRLIELGDSRINKEGVVVIKAQQYRTQEKNREAALTRLKILIQSVFIQQTRRVATKPSRNAKIKRADQKTKRGKVKQLRRKVTRIDD